MNPTTDKKMSLMGLFPADQVILDPVELITYEIDASVDRQEPWAVVFPVNTQDVIRAVSFRRCYCGKGRFDIRIFTDEKNPGNR
jgi:hypothetical protein